MKSYAKQFCPTLLMTGLLLSAHSTSRAAVVSINGNPQAVSQGEIVASARLRASSNSWDVAISNGQSYEARDAIRSNLERSFASPGREYDFTLEHIPGEGLVFSVTDTRTGRTTMHAWGTFSGSVPAYNAVPTLGGLAPGASFDALQIESRAMVARANTSFSNLDFSSPDLTVAGGSFYSASLTNSSVIGTNPRGSATQELLADVDLSDYAWTFAGHVSFQRQSGAEGADDISFTVNLRSASFPSPVPEPAGVLMLLAAAGSFAVRRRRA